MRNSETTIATTTRGIFLCLMITSSLTRAFTSSFVPRSANAARRAALATTTLTMTATATNPLLQQEDLPKFASIEPSHLTPAVTELLEKLESEFTSLEDKLSSCSSADASEDLSYDKVLGEVERMQFPLGFVWGVAGHLNGVKNGDELRTAYEENQPKVVQAMTKFSQSKALYNALEQLKAKQEEVATDDFEVLQEKRAVEGSLLDQKLGGVGLEGEAKEKFNEMRMRLAELSTTFSNNVLDATKAFSLTIEDPMSVDGVPASAKAMWANAHVQHLKSEGGEDVGEMDPDKGPWRITLDMPSYIAVMSHLPDRDIREKLYKAYITRASESSEEGKNNVPIVYEILKLKQDMAKLLGFKNFAEQSLAKKMAPSVKAVEELSDLILEKALPAAEKELAEITSLAKEKGGPTYESLDKLMPWDTTFWSERLKESKFDMTEEELRPYFALPNVLDGMFGLVERIFNIEVKPADGTAEVWHPDVQFFNVYDKDTQEHIASFYLDPYSRPADKRGGAWMDVCVGKSEAVKRQIPVAYLTCNGSPPVGDTPSLMTFREVETLFHETGHGLQHMLTKAKIGDVAGINGVEWDAVELPSQFMENWCYDRPTVYGFAKHYETGEPLPEDKFQKLCDQKTFNAGMMACRQLLFGQTDMELYSNYDPDPEGPESIFDVYKRVAAKYTPYNKPIDEDRFLCQFGHIFSGGYSAGYYSYKWAEVMSADAFGAFEEVGLDNEEEVKKVGMSFRETVLALGGGVPPMEVFERFRGRQPSPEALLRHNGLA